MKRRQILLNAITTFGQVFVNAAVLFFLYRFLLHTIGIEGLGIWSLVLATTSAVTLANQGFSTSIVKYVARYVALGKPAHVSQLIQTAMLATALFFAVFCVVLYPAAVWILKFLLPSQRVAEGVAVLPYALISLWLNLVGSVCQAGLIGHELITRRNFAVVLGLVLYFLSSLALVPGYGLLGLAVAQTAQAGFNFVLTWGLLRRCTPGLAVLPYQWNQALFREMMAYGVNLQFITVSQAVREPLTKALLAKFGGLAYTGFYDMASRWVFTFRELIVQANQVLVPTVSSLSERAPQRLSEVYAASCRVLLFVAVPTFGFLIVVSPVVCNLWIGHYEPLFVLFSVLLAIGWLFNIISNPAYVIYLGIGSVRWVTISSILSAALTGLLGIGLGSIFGGTAVAVASIAALMIGSGMVPAAYHIENRVPWKDLFARDGLNPLGISLGGAVLFTPLLLALKNLPPSAAPTVEAVALAALVIVVLPVWLHPLRKQLVLRVSSEFLWASRSAAAVASPNVISNVVDGK